MQLDINLPITESEPEPYYLRIWRYRIHEDIPYLTKEEAIADCAGRVAADLDEYVEGIYYQNQFIGRWERRSTGEVIFEGPYT